MEPHSLEVQEGPGERPQAAQAAAPAEEVRRAVPLAPRPPAGTWTPRHRGRSAQRDKGVLQSNTTLSTTSSDLRANDSDAQTGTESTSEIDVFSSDSSQEDAEPAAQDNSETAVQEDRDPAVQAAEGRMAVQTYRLYSRTGTAKSKRQDSEMTGFASRDQSRGSSQERSDAGEDGEEENFHSFHIVSDDDEASEQEQLSWGPAEEALGVAEAVGSAFRLVNMRRRRNLARFNDVAPGSRSASRSQSPAPASRPRYVHHIDPFSLHHQHEGFVWDRRLPNSDRSFNITSNNIRNFLHNEAHTPDGFTAVDHYDPFGEPFVLSSQRRRWRSSFFGTLTPEDLARHNAAYMQRGGNGHPGSQSTGRAGSSHPRGHGRNTVHPQNARNGERPAHRPRNREAQRAAGANGDRTARAQQGRNGDRAALAQQGRDTDRIVLALQGRLPAQGHRDAAHGHRDGAQAHRGGRGGVARGPNPQEGTSTAASSTGTISAGDWLVAFIERARAVPLKEACMDFVGDDLGIQIADYVGSVHSSERECGSNIDMEEVPNGEQVKGYKRIIRHTMIGEGRPGFMMDGDASISTPGHTTPVRSDGGAFAVELMDQVETWARGDRAFSGLA